MEFATIGESLAVFTLIYVAKIVFFLELCRYKCYFLAKMMQKCHFLALRCNNMTFLFQLMCVLWSSFCPKKEPSSVVDEGSMDY